MHLNAVASIRFRRARVLVVGCGDVGLRVAHLLRGRVRVLALVRGAGRADALRQQGVLPLMGDLDRPGTLRRLAGIATRVLHLAPPPGVGRADPRTRALVQALGRRRLPAHLVYGSTSGVYGDCAGAWVAESRPTAAATPRAQRRVDAERRLRASGRKGRWRVCILRIPGIYAPGRPNGTPHARLLRRTPVLHAAEDVYTSHIHAEDLARACQLALWRGRAQRVYHASDESALRMGEYFDLAADLYGLPRPPRISRAEAVATLGAVQMGFWSESRRLVNTRLKRELGLRLRYPTVREGLQAAA